MAKKFLDSAGLAVVWEKVKAQDATNLQSAKEYTDEKFGEIPAAIVYKGDGTTITQSGDGTVTFSVGAIDQSKVTGLTDALAGKANTVHTHVSADITDLQDKLDGKANAVHTHAIADLTDLNEGWDALLKAAPDVVTSAQLGNKADKTEALKDVTATAAADASKVTVTLSKTPISGAAKTSTVDVPAAQATLAGVITENRVKTLAGEVAGSVYKVKGTKATIDEVLEVGTAAVGDVYNVTAEFTLNSQKFPAGTNVVFVGPGEEGEPDPTQQAQWDALGGTVDLTPYETTAHATETYATKESVTTLQGQVATKAEQSEVTELSGKVDTNTTAIATKLDTNTFTAHVNDRKTLHLPKVTEADNGKVLGVVDGNAGWATMSIPLAEGTTTAGIVKAADDSVTISAGTIKVEAMTTAEIEGICI